MAARQLLLQRPTPRNEDLRPCIKCGVVKHQDGSRETFYYDARFGTKIEEKKLHYAYKACERIEFEECITINDIIPIDNTFYTSITGISAQIEIIFQPFNKTFSYPKHYTGPKYDLTVIIPQILNNPMFHEYLRLHAHPMFNPTYIADYSLHQEEEDNKNDLINSTINGDNSIIYNDSKTIYDNDNRIYSMAAHRSQWDAPMMPNQIHQTLKQTQMVTARPSWDEMTAVQRKEELVELFLTMAELPYNIIEILNKQSFTHWTLAIQVACDLNNEDIFTALLEYQDNNKEKINWNKLYPKIYKCGNMNMVSQFLVSVTRSIDNNMNWQDQLAMLMVNKNIEALILTLNYVFKQKIACNWFDLIKVATKYGLPDIVTIIKQNDNKINKEHSSVSNIEALIGECLNELTDNNNNNNDNNNKTKAVDYNAMDIDNDDAECHKFVLNRLTLMMNTDDRDQQKKMLIEYFDMIGDDTQQMLRDFAEVNFKAWYLILSTAYEAKNKIIFTAILEHCMFIKFPFILDNCLSMVYADKTTTDAYYVSQIFNYIVLTKQIDTVNWSYHLLYIICNHIYCMFEVFTTFIERERIKCNWDQLIDTALNMLCDTEIIRKLQYLQQCSELDKAPNQVKRPIRHLRPAIQKPTPLTLNTLNSFAPINETSPVSFNSGTTDNDSVICIKADDETNDADTANTETTETTDNPKNVRFNDDVKTIEDKDDIYENEDHVGAFAIDEPLVESTRQQWLKNHQNPRIMLPGMHYNNVNLDQHNERQQHYSQPTYKPTYYPQYQPTYYPQYQPTYYPQYQPTHYQNNAKLLSALKKVLQTAIQDNLDFDPEVIESHVNDYLLIEEKSSGPPPMYTKHTSYEDNHNKNVNVNENEDKEKNITDDPVFDAIYKATQRRIQPPTYIA